MNRLSAKKRRKSRPKRGQYDHLAEIYEKEGLHAAIMTAWDDDTRAFQDQTDRILGLNHFGRNPKGKSRPMR